MDSPYVIVGDANQPIELHAAAADWAVRQQLAVYTGSAPPPAPLVVTATQERTPSRETGLVTEPEPDDPDDEPEPPKETPKRPYGNASKDVWAEYAAAVDPEMSIERAKGMTKNDLLARYGQRL